MRQNIFCVGSSFSLFSLVEPNQNSGVVITHRVLVFHVGAEGVSGAVDLAALRTRARVRGAHAHHVKLARHCRKNIHT